MEKNKRNKIIGLSLGILVVLIIVVSSTYAYWQITETQTTPNDIVAACLSLDLNDADAENTGINLDSAWPISDDEGKSLTGYTFTVTNNCNQEINYIVGLNRVEEETANYLLDSSVKLQLDDNSSFTYGDLSDVEYVDATNTEYTARVSKQVSVETIGAKGTNTHTIRIWVSEDAPVTEQSKTFLGQVFITGGQGIEIPECFTIANNGTIIGYDESCGLEVKVPAEINGIQVKNITAYSFPKFDVAFMVGLYGEINSDGEYSNNDTIIYYGDTSYKSEIETFFCDGSTTCNLEDMGYIIIESVEEYNAFDWTKYGEVYQAEAYNYDEETKGIIWANSNIKSLDLSETTYLEEIGWASFAAFSSDGLETIGSLEKLLLPEDGMLTNIGGNSFVNNQIKEIIIPASVVAVDGDIFKNNQITSLTFIDTEENPSQLKTMGSDVFSDNAIEGTLTIPSAVEEIGGSAFSDNNITKVVLPSSISKITSGAGYVVFNNNPNLTEIIIKKESGDSITGVSEWPSGVTITYDPNYTE